MKNKSQLNLLPAIEKIEEQIEEMERKFEEEIAPYRKSLEELKKINTACPKCGGVGRYLRSRACAEDDRPDPNNPGDWKACPECHGTGLQRK